MPLTVNDAQSLLKNVALMAADHTEAGKSLEKMSGGSGRIGILNGRVIKFNTHVGERLLGPSANEEMYNACNELRRNLLDASMALIGDNSRAIAKIKSLLNISQDGNRMPQKQLLDRSVAMKVLKEISKNSGFNAVSDLSSDDIRGVSSRDAGGNKIGSTFDAKKALLIFQATGIDLPPHLASAQEFKMFKKSPASCGNVAVENPEYVRKAIENNLEMTTRRGTDTEFKDKLEQLVKDIIRGKYSVTLGNAAITVSKDVAQSSDPHAKLAEDITKRLEEYFKDPDGNIDRKAIYSALCSTHQGVAGAVYSVAFKNDVQAHAENQLFPFMPSQGENRLVEIKLEKGDAPGEIRSHIAMVVKEPKHFVDYAEADVHDVSPHAGSYYVHTLDLTVRTDDDMHVKFSCEHSAQNMNMKGTEEDRKVISELEILYTSKIPDEKKAGRGSIGEMIGNAIRWDCGETLVRHYSEFKSMLTISQ